MSNFGVTHTMVRDQLFPQWGAFTADGNPSMSTVSAFIAQKYAELAGLLAVKQITASAVDAASSSVAYAWCQETLLLMVGQRVLQSATQRNPELAKSWQESLTNKDKTGRLDMLAAYGATALGNAGLDGGASESGGPTDFIEELGIEVPDSSLSSGVAPPIRKDDQL